MPDCCCDDCCCKDCCNRTCWSNCCLKFLLLLIMTLPIIINTIVFCLLGTISNLLFGIYYTFIGWMCENSCINDCCECCYCKNCFAESIKNTWKPLSYFWNTVYKIFSNPILEEKDVIIQYSN